MIAASFIVMKDNVHEMPDFVAWASLVGVERVVFTNLNGVFDQKTLLQVTYEGYYDTPTDLALRELAATDALRRGRELGIEVILYGDTRARRLRGCSGMADVRPYVAYNGDVSPCCVLTHPVERLARSGQLISCEPYVLGNVNETPLELIWQRPDYREFRESIRSGGSPRACCDCIGLYSVSFLPYS